MTHDHDPDFTNPKLNGAQTMSDAEIIAEVLAAHWSFTTDADQNPFVDRCDGCKEAVYSWGSPSSEQQNARPAHQAEMVAAALKPVIRERENAAWDACDDAWQFAHKMDNIEPWGYIKPNPYDTKEEA